MRTGLNVSDAMTQNPIAVQASMPLSEVAAFMAEKDIGAVIVNQGEEFIGILTENGIVRLAVSKSLDPSETTAADVANVKPLTIGPNEDIFEAMKLMSKHSMRHICVLNEGVLVGLLTLKDILKIQPQLYELMIERFELREAERKAGLMSKVKLGSVAFGEDIEH